MKKYIGEPHDDPRLSLQPPTLGIKEVHTTRKVTLKSITSEEVEFIIGRSN